MVMKISQVFFFSFNRLFNLTALQTTSHTMSCHAKAFVVLFQSPYPHLHIPSGFVWEGSPPNMGCDRRPGSLDYFLHLDPEHLRQCLTVTDAQMFIQLMHEWFYFTVYSLFPKCIFNELISIFQNLFLQYIV